MEAHNITKVFTVIKKIKNWSQYFLDSFSFIKNRGIIYQTRSGEKIKVRAGTTDRIVINEVFIYNDYTPRGFEIGKKDIVFDVGAHIGAFSVFASKLAGKVYSFEPVAESFKILEENVALNSSKNVFPLQSAISSETGFKDLYLCDENPGANSFYIKDRSSKKAKVSTVSLSDFVKSNNILAIDFMKMDCEGAEYNILFNCPKEVLSIIKKISMEYHDIDEKMNAAVLKKFLENNGFSVAIKADKCHYLFANKI